MDQFELTLKPELLDTGVIHKLYTESFDHAWLSRDFLIHRGKKKKGKREKNGLSTMEIKRRAHGQRDVRTLGKNDE